jgi:predicted dehydrogenase
MAVRIAVAGNGFMGRTHAQAIAGISGTELACIIDRDGLASALRDPEIDAVDLCIPTDLHASVAIDALRAGKHVLVEKPMALDAASCDRMIAEAARHNRVLMVAHVLRFMPPYAALRPFLRDEPVRTALFRRQCGEPDWAPWLLDPARSGGGAFDLLIHDADIALHLFGAPRAISATGSGDMISAQLHYASGLAVEISGGWFHRGFPFSMGYTIATGRATYHYDSPAGAARRYPDEDFEIHPADGYFAEIAYFAECVRDQKPPERCPPRESAEAVRLMLALIAARRRHGEKIAWISE